MIKKLLGAGLIAGSLVLSGCSSNPATVVLAIADVSEQVESGSIITKLKLKTMAEKELSIIATNLQTLLRIQEKYKGLEDNPQQLITNITTLSTDQLLAENAYRKIYQVASNHWDEYSLLDKWKLEQFDESANVINDEVKAFIKAVELKEAAKTIYQLSSTTARVLTLM